MIVPVTAAETALFERALGGGDGPAAFAGAPGTLAFVAVAAGAPPLGWCWGYVLPRPDGPPMAYLHHLEVIPASRRQGLGRQLLSAFKTAATQQGATRMFLTTGATNKAARALYDSLGGTLATQGPTVNYWFPLPPTPPPSH